MAAPKRLIDTQGMDRQRWLECRMHGPLGDLDYTVGGSDVAAIFGISPWVTPLELWHMKKKLMSVVKTDNVDQMEMGHMLEPIAAHWYAKRTGNTVINDTWLYQHESFPYALANFDYRYQEPGGQAGILECKSTTYHKAIDWIDDAIPAYYELQLRFYLAVADVEVGDFACLWGNNPKTDLATPRIWRDMTKENIIFEKLERWIWSLRHDKPPTMEDIKPDLALAALARIYGAGKTGLPTIEFPRTFETPLRRIAHLQAENADLQQQMKKNDKELEGHAVRIAELMKQHEHGIMETTTDKLLIDFVTKTTRRPDSGKLKKDYPQVYQDVLKVSESRRVKVTVETA